MIEFKPQLITARVILHLMKRSRLALVAVCSALSCFAHGQGGNDLPLLGDASSSLISPEMERQIGEDFLKQVRSALPTVKDPILKYYVDNQLRQLVEYSQLREPVLGTVLIDEKEINAFAAPGGVFGINLGLMLHAEDVHEYSSVVAHELAHLSQRHFARGVEVQKAQTLPMLAGMLVAIFIGVAGGGDAGLAAISSVQSVGQANMLRYSRGREQEADRIGLNTLVQAGLDPQGMARMFERMHRAYRFTHKPPEFLLTHPLSETRVSDARTQALQYSTKLYSQSMDYQMMRARTQVHFAESPKAIVQVFEQELKNQPDNAATSYGLALAYSLAGRHDEAIPLVDQVYTSDQRDILLSASLADLLIAAGRNEQAIQLVERELRINPDNAPLSMFYAKALSADGRYLEAEAVLKRQSIMRKNDVDVWYDLAEVSGLAGDIIGVHLARSQFFYLHAAYQRALQHLEYARRLTSEDDQQSVARLNQRIMNLRTKMREKSS